MNEKTVIITEKDGTYHLENNGISEFTLLGILECIVFDMKTAKRKSVTDESKTVDPPAAAVSPGVNNEPAQDTNTPDLRTRISNALKAIRSLGGETANFDVNSASDEELQEELEALTEQYKRLKHSKKAVK